VLPAQSFRAVNLADVTTIACRAFRMEQFMFAPFLKMADDQTRPP
jgi:hypothetical protein